MYLRIDSSDGYFLVNDKGQISRFSYNKSELQFFENWIFRGIRARNAKTQFISREALIEKLKANDKSNPIPMWKYKNGKHVWNVCDIDHGSYREWTTPIHRIILEE